MRQHSPLSTSLCVSLICLSLTFAACANDTSSDSGTPTGGASAPTAGASAPTAGTSAPTAGTNAPTAGTSAPTATLPEGTINTLTPDQRRQFCEVQVGLIFSELNISSPGFSDAAANFCFVSGLFSESAEECEMDRVECTTEIMNVMLEAKIEECLSDDAFFSSCGALVAEVSTCQVAQTTTSFYGFAMLDTSAYTCANAGDFGTLMPLFQQLSGLEGADELCTPAAMACFADEDMP